VNTIVETPTAPFYRGPYILARINDELRFIPAKQGEQGKWVALTPEEIEAQTS
jgi:hypothetical protein